MGVESTIVDFTGEKPVILRPGGVTYDDLKGIGLDVEIDKNILHSIAADEVPKCPGMKYKHYAPNAEVTVVEGEKDAVQSKIKESGDIKGVAGVVGCSNLTAGGHDVLTVELTKELIARDIIVLTAGCSSGGIENCGLMTPEAAQFAGPKLRAVCEKLGIPPVLNFGPCLAIGRLEIVATELAETIGVDLPQLPLVLSAAQWLEEQALADGCFGLALGLPLHLGLPPFVTGSGAAVKILTEDMKELTGGQVIINPDAKESADILEKIILEKRDALHI